jgi:O-antigen/teichoic acid export membrane protein
MTIRSRLLRDSAWTLIAELITGAATLASGILIARATGPEGKGIFALATGFAALGAAVLGLRWERPTGYFLAKNRDALPAIIGSICVFGVFATLGALVLWSCLPNFFEFALLRGVGAWCITLTMLLIGTHFLYTTIPAIYGGLRDFRARSMFVSASAVPLIVPTSVLFLLGEHRVAIYLEFYLLTCAAVYLGWLVALTIKRRVTPRLNVELLRRMVCYGSLSYVSLVMDIVTLRLDVFLINYLISAREVGIYSVAIGISARLAGIPNILSHVVFYRASANEIGNGEITARLLRMTMLMMILCGVVLAVASKVLIVPFYGAAFDRSVAPLLVMIPASIFWGLFRLLASDIEGRGRPGWVSACSLVASVTIIGLDLLWIPRYAVMGAAWASLIAYGIAFAGSVIAFYRLTGVPLHGSSRIDQPGLPLPASALGRLANIRP